MSEFETGLNLMDALFGNGKDTVISLATIAREPGDEGKPRPVVRSVNAYYEDGAFYVVTLKMLNGDSSFEPLFPIGMTWQTMKRMKIVVF